MWQLRLPLPYPATSRVNAYLLEQPDGFCLVDCGSSLEPGWRALEHALALAGIEAGDLTLLVTTHGHNDHAGLASAVLERTGCEYARLDAPHTMSELPRDLTVPRQARLRAASEQGLPPELLTVWTETHVAGDGKHLVAQPHRLLSVGEGLPSVVGDWTVHAAPGHNASQLMLFNGRRGWLLSADLVLRTDTPFVEWGHTPDPFADHLSSLLAARALEPSLLLPGHGRPVLGVEDQLTYALAAAEASRERILGLLSYEPQTPYELSSRLVGERADLDRRQSAFSVVLAVVDHLERAGAVASVAGADGLRRVVAKSCPRQVLDQ